MPSDTRACHTLEQSQNFHLQNCENHVNESFTVNAGKSLHHNISSVPSDVCGGSVLQMNLKKTDNLWVQCKEGHLLRKAKKKKIRNNLSGNYEKISGLKWAESCCLLFCFTVTCFSSEQGLCNSSASTGEPCNHVLTCIVLGSKYCLEHASTRSTRPPSRRDPADADFAHPASTSVAHSISICGFKPKSCRRILCLTAVWSP